MKRVIIVEDQTAIREMLVMILKANPGYSILGETGDGQHAHELLLKDKPDLAILDIMLPGMNGVELVRRVSRQVPSMRLLVFSGHQNVSLVKETIRAGAHGFVEKTASLAELQKGIEVVASGGSYFGPIIAELLRDAVLNPAAASSSSDVLTAREREVLQLIAESHTTKEVAAKLNVSVKTADNHRTNLMRKLNLHDVASLTRYAIEIGLVEEKRSLPFNQSGR